MDDDAATSVAATPGSDEAVALATRLTAVEAALDDLLEHTADLGFLADAAGHIRVVNRAWRQAVGLVSSDAATAVEQFIEAASRTQFRAAYARTLADGAAVTLAATFRTWDGKVVEAVGRLLRHERASGPVICGLFRDLSAQRFQEARQSHLATRDPLTSLANRALFAQHLPLALARARRQGTLAGVVLINLDSFRHVNDLYGHVSGDQVLIAVADRLKRCVRTEDLVARFAADQFAIVLERLHTLADATFVVERAFATAMTPLLTPTGEWVHPGVSIGVAVSDGHAADADTLLREAEGVLREVKRAGGGRFLIAQHEEGATA